MFRSLKKLLGEHEQQACAHAEPPPSLASAAQAEQYVTTSVLGQTLVATIVEPDLTAEKVAELSHWLRTVMACHPTAKNLVIDLEHVDYLDSSCLNLFVTLLQHVKQAGGAIAIAAAASRVEVLFKLTRLDKVFMIKREVIDAIDAVERIAA